jgi:hypothetical protein
VETSRLPHFLTVSSQMAVRLSVLRAGCPLPPRKIPGTHFCQRLSRPKGHSATGRIRSIEKSSDLIGNRTRNLPAITVQAFLREDLGTNLAQGTDYSERVFLCFSSVPPGKFQDIAWNRPHCFVPNFSKSSVHSLDTDSVVKQPRS